MIIYNFLPFIYIFLLFSQKINLVTADLGRHIKNGELLLTKGYLLYTNTYSYTQPEYPVVTHHWGSGLLFYLLWKIGSFPLISFVYAALSTFTVFLFYWAAKKEFGKFYALVSTLLALPLIVSRTEIRPEGLSFLLLGIFWVLIKLYQQGKLKFSKVLIITVFLQILWVNTHIFFLFGPFLIFAFFLQSEVEQRLNRRNLFILLIASAASSLVNPFFVKGALIPFTILGKSGYMVAENQSILFMQKRFGGYLYFHTEILIFLTLLCFFYLFFWRKKIRPYLALFILTVFFLLLAWNVNRALPLYGLFLIPFFSCCLKQAFKKLQLSTDIILNHLYIGVAGFFFLLIFPSVYSPFYHRNPGLGLAEGVNRSAEFFKSVRLRGPIFNNYDIGSYLIYHFYPSEKVFVDNRPEEYNPSFFQNVYIPSQEDESVWEQLQKKYQFNLIYFYRHDFTPWAQPFLIRRVKDPSWAPIYVDDYAIILIKDTFENQPVIQKFRLPRPTFKGETLQG